MEFLKTKKGSMDAKTGVYIAMSAIFVLAIGLGVTDGVITDLNLTGLTATVVGYAPLVIGAVFIWMVAKQGGVF